MLLVVEVTEMAPTGNRVTCRKVVPGSHRGKGGVSPPPPHNTLLPLGRLKTYAKELDPNAMDIKAIFAEADQFTSHTEQAVYFSTVETKPDD